MWNYVGRGLVGILLIITSVQDIRWKKIRLWVVILGMVLICICIPFSTTLSVLDRLLGITPGIGVLILSKLTSGKIGMGDGLILGVTGIELGFWGNMELFALALLFAALFSIVLLILRRADRKKAIPFIPFILLAYIVLMVQIK
ncbi:MAG: hypothetical protein GX379_08975 [Clostridiales bacterium]|jgi:leader peptidase (prepilin peptidase)/N-methyltransferase|nr:hypothetical protein [Clostridiales bacterium]